MRFNSFQHPASRTRTLRWMGTLTASLLPLLLLLIARVDRPLMQWLHMRTGRARPFFEALTTGFDWGCEHVIFIKSPPVGLLVLALAAAGLWARRHRFQAVLLLQVLLTHLASKETAYHLKKWTSRPRPSAILPLGTAAPDFWSNLPHADSFPSMHTVVAWSLALPLALYFPRYRWAMLLGPVLLGLGRIVLEAHYLTDVLFSVYLVAMYTLLFSLLYPQLTLPQLPSA